MRVLMVAAALTLAVGPAYAGCFDDKVKVKDPSVSGGYKFLETPSKDEISKDQTPEKNKKTPIENKEDYKKKLGAGVSLTLDTGSHDRVNDAEIVDGVVRVKDEDNVKARILLEGHYFFLPNCPFLGVQPKNWGVGPF